jgi:hypothetical protein
MLAATKPTSRGKAPRARGRGQAIAANGARRIGAFVLARPGTVAMTLLFGGLGLAVSANALWMQSAHHPAPLFRQAALQPQHPAAKRAPEEPAAPTAAAPAGDQGGAILPPSRPAGFGRTADQGAAVPAKPAPGKHAAPKDPAKDPIGDLLGGPAPVPPAPIKPGAAAKGQPVEKAARPAPPRGNDAIAGLIEQSARSR